MAGFRDSLPELSSVLGYWGGKRLRRCGEAILAPCMADPMAGYDIFQRMAKG